MWADKFCYSCSVLMGHVNKVEVIYNLLAYSCHPETTMYAEALKDNVNWHWEWSEWKRANFNYWDAADLSISNFNLAITQTIV